MQNQAEERAPARLQARVQATHHTVCGLARTPRLGGRAAAAMARGVAATRSAAAAPSKAAGCRPPRATVQLCPGHTVQLSGRRLQEGAAPPRRGDGPGPLRGQQNLHTPSAPALRARRTRGCTCWGRAGRPFHPGGRRGRPTSRGDTSCRRAPPAAGGVPRVREKVSGGPGCAAAGAVGGGGSWAPWAPGRWGGKVGCVSRQPAVAGCQPGAGCPPPPPTTHPPTL